MNGESSLIRAIYRQLQQHQQAPGVIAGIGDDAAVLAWGPGNPPYLVVTVDLLMEDVHFQRQHITPWQLGRRALAVNLSDIAAMGAQPRYALVSLGLPPGITSTFLEEFYRGMRALADAHGTSVVGGNLSRSGTGLVADVMVLGEVTRPLLRSGAQPGDLVAVSGQLGLAAAGWHWLQSRGDRAGPTALQPAVKRCLHAQLEPEPRVELGCRLAQAGATSMIDISDGLASECHHLVRASQVGLVLQADLIPVAEEVRVVCQELGLDPLELALSGGEDYELLFTLPRRHWPAAAAAAREVGVPITPLGQIFSAQPPGVYLGPESIVHLRAPEASPQLNLTSSQDIQQRGWRQLAAAGWDHLGSEGLRPDPPPEVKE